MDSLILAALKQPSAAIFRSLHESLLDANPDRAVFLCEEYYFDLLGYSAAGFCSVKPHPTVPLDLVNDHRGDDVVRTPVQGWYTVEWQGHQLDVILVAFPWQHHMRSRQFIIASSAEIAEAFYVELDNWQNEVRAEVLVFDDGYFSKDPELYQEIKSARFDNLILAHSLKEQIQADLNGFLTAKAVYDRYGVPWKRGILLLGPPGNGKTHTIKALVNSLGIPCLYVRSFETQCSSPQACMRALFKRARELAPCLIILEDLDSLVSPEVRSYFLNELDGFASNQGIIVIASTNHPDRLDPAILERPSRFDRKYTLELPELTERIAYLGMMTARFSEEMTLSEKEIVGVGRQTDGYSFAYLKELVLSSMMAWMSGGGEPLGMSTIMSTQVEALRAQMTTDLEAPGMPTSRKSVGAEYFRMAASMAGFDPMSE